MLNTLSAVLKAAPWVAILGLMLWAGRLNELRHDWQTTATEATHARIVDKQSYETAQRDASIKNKAHVQAVESQQKAVTDEVEKRLTARIDALREQLRDQPRPATPAGPSKGTTAPDVPAAPADPDATSRVCIPSSQFLLGAEYEEKLDEWVTWATKEGAIDPNK